MNVSASRVSILSYLRFSGSVDGGCCDHSWSTKKKEFLKMRIKNIILGQALKLVLKLLEVGFNLKDVLVEKETNRYDICIYIYKVYKSSLFPLTDIYTYIII